ncbi:two-component regulator propeller domain-containing protein [Aliikangiella maris]|uniref:Two-component regulator propeller domain-containing protein n=2 Tax=Aliikangiella maris TaxID=3162458 RepID=A0ABV2BRR4_9GAMM
MKCRYFSVWSIIDDPQGFLWVGTLSGLNRLQVATGDVRHFYSSTRQSTQS